MSKKQIDAINKIIDLLPKVSISKSTEELRYAYKRLRSAIKKNGIEHVFKQPMSEEEIEFRKHIEIEIEKFRKSGKKIHI